MKAASVNIAGLQQRRKWVLRALCVLLVLPVLVTASAWPPAGSVHEWIENTGIALIVICIVGRTWASLYIGGRKSKELTTRGPYSIMRNPLYTFFHSRRGRHRRPARQLHGHRACRPDLLRGVLLRGTAGGRGAPRKFFGAPYANYLRTVPRFFPDFRIWHDEQRLQVRIDVVRTVFLDSLFFLLAWPLLEIVEAAQIDEVLPSLLHLP